MFGRAWCHKGTRDIMEAAIKAPSIRVSGSLISVIRTVTIGPVDGVNRALRARSTRTRSSTSSSSRSLHSHCQWRTTRQVHGDTREIADRGYPRISPLSGGVGAPRYQTLASATPARRPISNDVLPYTLPAPDHYPSILVNQMQ